MSSDVVPTLHLTSASSPLIDMEELTDDDLKAITTLDPITVQRELNTTLDSEETKELIETEIRSLTQKTLRTRAAFEKIGSLLGLFDSMRFQDTKNTTEALRPGWESLLEVSTIIFSSITAHLSVT